MHTTGMDTLAARIAELEFAVLLLARLMQEQGLATESKITQMIQRGPKETRAAAVVKMLCTITDLIVVALEETAAKERRPALRVVSSSFDGRTAI